MAERSYPASEARGGGPEEPPHAGGQGRWLGGATQGAVVAWAQEGLEELSHVEGQEERSGRAVVRRYPSSKVRSSSCAFLEQP